MRPETGEWLSKAEADFSSMRREAGVAQSPNYDLVCFLAQQSAEKYLKGWLCEEGVAFPKTHDLNKLATLLPAPRSRPDNFAAILARLDRYAVEFRVSIHEIGVRWGFADHGYFHRAFKKQFGLTPVEARATTEQANGEDSSLTERRTLGQIHTVHRWLGSRM